MKFVFSSLFFGMIPLTTAGLNALMHQGVWQAADHKICFFLGFAVWKSNVKQRTIHHFFEANICSWRMFTQTKISSSPSALTKVPYDQQKHPTYTAPHVYCSNYGKISVNYVPTSLNYTGHLAPICWLNPSMDFVAQCGFLL